MGKTRKILIFGNFGTKNFGNEATLQAILSNLRRRMPEAEFACICTLPATASATHGIDARPISPPVITLWTPRNRLERFLRAIVCGIPSELYRWWRAFGTLKGADALIIPGTGLLTDAFGPAPWGPYGVFQWSLLAKLRGCRLLFVSVGAGPLDRRLSRLLVRSALRWADFRSYRDVTSRECLADIGLVPTEDRVSPDLAFSLPQSLIPCDRRAHRRPIAGLGLMIFRGMYGGMAGDCLTYRNYLDSLVILVEWLLDRGYDIRLLLGEIGDPVAEFRRILAQRLPAYDPDRIMAADQVSSVEQLLSQIAATDLVVATRFHNIVFALLNGKPTVSISFHEKCTSLMREMGLTEYCLRIDQLRPDDLMGKIVDIERNSARLKTLITRRCAEFREALEEQYGVVLARQARFPEAKPTSV